MMKVYEEVPNAIFPSDNGLGIPSLRLDLCADFVDAPLVPWGNAKPQADFNGTWHFYVVDAKFRALWLRPDRPLETAAPTLVECNFSLNEDTPYPLAAWWTYQKRWLARYWQERGRRIIVDLNVPGCFLDLNFHGVPRSWWAYAIRGKDAEVDLTEAAWERARSHAGPNGERLLFVVYGGGSATREWCESHTGAIWRPTVREEKRVKDSR